MTQKVFWKSALKASALMYFIIGILSTVILILFFSDKLDQIMSIAMTDKEWLEATAFPMTIMYVFLIFAWIPFGFLYKKIPFKKTIVKVFLFNLILVGIELLITAVFEIKNTDVLNEIFFGSDNCCYSFIPLFLLTTIMFAYLFDFFKKREEKEISGKTKNKLASIPRRLLAYIIDLIILSIIFGIISFIISSVANIMVFNSNIELSSVAVITLMSFCFVVAQTIYWTVVEGKFGASIGKKILKIKVIKENGKEISYIDAFFRNITKFADNLLPFLLIDALTIFTTKNKQRFFDKVAGTIVVRTDLKKEKLMLDSPKAGFIQRFSARIIDGLILLALLCISVFVSAIIIMAAGNDPTLIFLPALFLYLIHLFIFEPVYWIYFTATKGQTIGKQLRKIKIYTIEGNTPVGWKKSILRYFAYWISLYSFLLGLLWIIFDKNKQSWHDKFADTFTVREEKKAFEIKKYTIYLIAISITLGVFFGVLFSLIGIAMQGGIA